MKKKVVPIYSFPTNTWGSNSLVSSGLTDSKLDPELEIILKRTLKKDPLTRLKALQDLQSLSQTLDILPAWTLIYNRMGCDLDKRVREIVSSIHLGLGKSIKPILKAVIGVWMTLLFDPHPPVAKSAQTAFEVFNDKKALYTVCEGVLLTHISENLLDATPETMSDARYASPEEILSKYARVVSGTLCVLMTLIETLELPDQGPFKSLLDDHRFWKLLSSESNVRRTFYKLITLLCKRKPLVIQSRLEIISNAFLSRAFSDQDPSTHADLWDATLHLLRAFPATFDLASTKKPLLGKILFFLKNGAFGSVNVSYPSLLPLISVVPLKVWTEDSKSVQDFLEALWSGLGIVDSSSTHLVISAYLECILYWFIKVPVLVDSLTLAFFKPFWATLYTIKFPIVKSKFEDKWVPILSSHLQKLVASSQISSEIVSACTAYFQEGLLMTLDEQIYPEDYAELEDADLEIWCHRLGRVLVSMGSLTSLGIKSYSSFFESLLKMIFGAALAQMESMPFVGLDSLLRVLIHTFGTLLGSDKSCRTALVDFMVAKVPEIVKSYLSGSHELIESLFEVLKVVLASKTKGCHEAQTLWDALLTHIFELDQIEVQFRVFHYALTEYTRRELHDSVKLQHKSLDHLIMSLLEDPDRVSTQYVTESLAKLLSFRLDPTVIDGLTFTRLNEFIVKSFEKSGELFQVKDRTAHTLSSPLIAQLLFCVAIVRRLVEDTVAHHKDDHSSLRTMLGSIYFHVTELASFHPDTAVTVVLTGSGSITLESLKKLASEAKDLQGPLAIVLRKTEPLALSVMIGRWMDSWKQGFVNLSHCGSPSDFLVQLHTLLDFAADPSMSTIQRLILQPTFFDRGLWMSASEPFESEDESLFVQDAIAGLYGITQKAGISKAIQQDIVIEYDLDGLSLYARMALLVLGLARDRVLDTSSTASKGSEWVWIELARFRQICLDLEHLAIPKHIWPWKHTSPLTLSTLVDEISILIHAQAFRYSASLKETAKDVLGRCTSSTASFNQFQLAVAAFDGVLPPSSPTRRVSYARALQFILSESFSKNRDWLEEDLGMWMHIATVMDKKQFYEGSAAVLLALQPYISNLKAGRPFIRYTVEAVTHIDRAGFEDSASLPSVFVATYRLLLVIPFLLSDYKGDQLDVDDLTVQSLLNSFKSWFEGDMQTGVQSSDPSDRLRTLLTAVVARILCIFVGTGMPIPVPLARFVIEATAHWIRKFKPGFHQSPANAALMYQVLELWKILRDVFTDIPVLFAILFEVENSVTEACVQAFMNVAVVEKVTQSVDAIQSLLSELVSCIDLNDPHISILFEYDKVCEMLFVMNDQVQRMAFRVLKKQTRLDVQNKSLAIEVKTKEAKDVTVDGFLLSPSLMQALGAKDNMDTTFELKNGYISQIRSTSLLEQFLTIVFDVLNVGKRDAPFDLSVWDVSVFELDGFDFESELSMPLMAAHLYWRALSTIPSLVRNWFSECRNRQLSLGVEKYTETHFSPPLIKQELKLVEQKKKELPELAVRTSMALISAAYAIEDSSLEIQVKFPSCFPLRMTEVESGKAAGNIGGIQEGKWRAWLLAVSAIMTSQNGSVSDALGLFYKNVHFHFDGIEDCAICI